MRKIAKDREAWRAAAHGVAKSRTGLSDSKPVMARDDTQVPKVRILKNFLTGRKKRPKYNAKFKKKKRENITLY